MGFAENLHVLMVEHDITGRTIADIAEVTPSAVSRWRSGATPRWDAVDKLCEFFALSRDDLMSDTNGLAAKKYGRARPAREPQVLSLTAEEEQLLEIYRDLKAPDRGRLLGYAEGLVAARRRPPGGSAQVSA